MSSAIALFRQIDLFLPGCQRQMHAAVGPAVNGLLSSCVSFSSRSSGVPRLSASGCRSYPPSSGSGIALKLADKTSSPMYEGNANKTLAKASKALESLE